LTPHPSQRGLGLAPARRHYERRRDGSTNDGLLMDLLAGELVLVTRNRTDP
jgi:hypothetical protein